MNNLLLCLVALAIASASLPAQTDIAAQDCDRHQASQELSANVAKFDNSVPEMPEVVEDEANTSADNAPEVAAPSQAKQSAAYASGSYRAARAGECKKVFRSSGPLSRRGPVRRAASNARASHLERVASGNTFFIGRRIRAARAKCMLANMAARGAY
ncbi:MAG: hypothetical protein AAGB04_00205 [Pseudomonadota bacterium]